jgi:hypothetical protein
VAVCVARVADAGIEAVLLAQKGGKHLTSSRALARKLRASGGSLGNQQYVQIQGSESARYSERHGSPRGA